MSTSLSTVAVRCARCSLPASLPLLRPLRAGFDTFSVGGTTLAVVDPAHGRLLPRRHRRRQQRQRRRAARLRPPRDQLGRRRRRHRRRHAARTLIGVHQHPRRHVRPRRARASCKRPLGDAALTGINASYATTFAHVQRPAHLHAHGQQHHRRHVLAPRHRRRHARHRLGLRRRVLRRRPGRTRRRSSSSTWPTRR